MDIPTKSQLPWFTLETHNIIIPKGRLHLMRWIEGGRPFPKRMVFWNAQWKPANCRNIAKTPRSINDPSPNAGFDVELYLRVHINLMCSAAQCLMGAIPLAFPFCPVPRDLPHHPTNNSPDTPLENNGRGDALIICVVLLLFAMFIVVSEEARRWATATLQNTRQSCRYSSLYGALHERRLCRRRHRSRHPCVLFNTAPNVPSVHKFSATITTVNMCRKDTFTISHIPYIHSNHIDWFYTRF